MKGVFNDDWPRRGTSQTEKRKGFGESRVRGGIRTKIIDDYGGLHNRLTRQIYLRPFSLAECEALVRANGHIMNRDQILEGYMVMGGVPYYWDLLRKDISLAQHIDAIKRKLGISGVVTRTYGWRFIPEGSSEDGAQIDLVIERDDKVVNLCEMKYTAGPFTISDEYDRRLKIKREVYAEQTGSKDAIHLTMVSAHGLKANANASDVQSVVTLDDLMRS